MFGNDNPNPNTNGELQFYNDIKDKINVIFDVGCREDTLFNNFNGDVHYFEPMDNFLNKLKTQEFKNKNSYFNNFGLSNENNTIYYYPKYQSFLNRTKSCYYSDERNKISLTVKKAKDYIVENNITSIDFVKIDTEGYEYNVIKGFEDSIKLVKYIQFEYGGTFLDCGIKLKELIDYLVQHNFTGFSYLSGNGLVPLDNFNDHYTYCNIVCYNKTLLKKFY